MVQSYEGGSFTKDSSCSDWVGEIFVGFFWSLMGGGRQWEDWSHMKVWLKYCLLQVSLMKYTRVCNYCCQWNWPWCKENDVIIAYCSDCMFGIKTLRNTVSQCFVCGSPPSGKVVSHEPPLPLRNNCLSTPPSPSEFPMIFRGGYGYFLEPHNTTYFSVYIYTQVCYSHVLSLELSIKTILMQALYSEELSH